MKNCVIHDVKAIQIVAKQWPLEVIKMFSLFC